MSTTAITVTNSATLLLAANSRRVSISIENRAGVTLYWGDDDTVTAGTAGSGQTLAHGERIVDNIPSVYRYMYRGAYYGILESGSVKIQVLELTEST